MVVVGIHKHLLSKRLNLLSKILLIMLSQDVEYKLRVTYSELYNKLHKTKDGNMSLAKLHCKYFFINIVFVCSFVCYY